MSDEGGEGRLEGEVTGQLDVAFAVIHVVKLFAAQSAYVPAPKAPCRTARARVQPKTHRHADTLRQMHGKCECTGAQEVRRMTAAVCHAWIMAQGFGAGWSLGAGQGRGRPPHTYIHACMHAYIHTALPRCGRLHNSATLSESARARERACERERVRAFRQAFSLPLPLSPPLSPCLSPSLSLSLSLALSLARAGTLSLQ